MTETNHIPRLRRAQPTATACSGCGRRLEPGVGFWCPTCRTRKHRGALITGECCAVQGCGIDSPRVLRWHRFADDTLPLCANHEALAGRRSINWAAFHAEALEHELQGWTLKSA